MTAPQIQRRRRPRTSSDALDASRTRPAQRRPVIEPLVLLSGAERTARAERTRQRGVGSPRSLRTAEVLRASCATDGFVFRAEAPHSAAPFWTQLLPEWATRPLGAP
jgi:hypothetical protein